MTNPKNLPALTRTIPAPTPQHAQSLSPAALSEHRQRIAFEVEVILQGYWQQQLPDAIKAAHLADWSDTLQDWTHDQVLWGLRKWRNEFPSKKPNPGHILSLLKDQRGKTEAAKMEAAKMEPPETEKVRVTDEQRAQILAEAGMRQDENGLVVSKGEE